MRKFVAVFMLAAVISSISYVYSAPAIACTLQKIAAAIIPDHNANVVAFGVKLGCKANGNVKCSGVMYVMISDPQGNPVFYDSVVLSTSCGNTIHKIINVIADDAWWTGGYTASFMVYDEATWLEVVSTGPVPLN